MRKKQGDKAKRSTPAVGTNLKELPQKLPDHNLTPDHGAIYALGHHTKMRSSHLVISVA